MITVENIEATVVAVLPEFKQAQVRTDDGFMYVLTAKTPGLKWHQAKEGDRIRGVVKNGRLLIAEAGVPFRDAAPYCAKLIAPCPDGCAALQLTGCGGGTAGDCWRVKPPAP